MCQPLLSGEDMHLYWQAVQRDQQTREAKKMTNTTNRMYRATLTIHGEFVWSGVFDEYPTTSEVIDAWRLEDKKSATFDKVDIVPCTS